MFIYPCHCRMAWGHGGHVGVLLQHNTGLPLMAAAVLPDGLIFPICACECVLRMNWPRLLKSGWCYWRLGCEHSSPSDCIYPSFMYNIDKNIIRFKPFFSPLLLHLLVCQVWFELNFYKESSWCNEGKDDCTSRGETEGCRNEVSWDPR